MESKEDVKSLNLNKFAKMVDAAVQMADQYEPSKPTSMVFTKLEEALLWMQVVVAQVPLKNADNNAENNVEMVDGA